MMNAEGKLERSDVLHDFKAHFFSMSRLSAFPWHMVEEELAQHKASELISDILRQTCLHPLSQRRPPAATFRRRFLSELIKRHEAAGQEPLDELYDALGSVLAAAHDPDCYKSYILPSGEAVSLLESAAVISEGTTGLVTWEAALYLAEWALEHPQVFSGRVVLELGSGVGLTGVTICRSCRPSRFVFSDAHPSVLQALRRNVRLNGLSDEATDLRVSVIELDWTAIAEEQLRAIGPNVVIAADVVYDPELTGSLVMLLSKLLKCSPPNVLHEVLICSTVRNPSTYSGFKQQLDEAGIQHAVLPAPRGHVFPYSRASPIQLLRLTM